jgi:DNA-binding response OmpR family regulator
LKLLRRELEHAQDKIAAYEQGFQQTQLRFNPVWKLTQDQEKLLLALYNTTMCTRVMLTAYLSRTRDCESRAVDKAIVRLRQRLSNNNIDVQISAKAGYGYYLTPENKQRLKAYCEGTQNV